LCRQSHYSTPSQAEQIRASHYDNIESLHPQQQQHYSDLKEAEKIAPAHYQQINAIDVGSDYIDLQDMAKHLQ
jgi:hypothetical protein